MKTEAKTDLRWVLLTRVCRTVLGLSLMLWPLSFLPAEVCPGNSSIDQVPVFVDQAYSDVLGRTPDPNGREYHIRDLRESDQRLCRSADPNVAVSECEWKNNARLVMEFLGSPEASSKIGPLDSNKDFVAGLYHVLLRRAPDAGGLNSHLATLSSTGDRLSLVLDFLLSAEYRNRFSCTTPTLARSAEFTGPRGHTQLGVNGHPLTKAVYSNEKGVSYEEQFTALKDLGAQWYRFDVGVPPTGPDTAKMDPLVKAAKAHDIRLLPVIFPSIDRDHDDLSTIYKKSYDGAFKMASQYKSYIQVWELSNEQDIYSAHKAGDPGWNRSGNDGDQPSDYSPTRFAIVAAMMRGLSEGVRAADPSARRIINFAGWLHTGFFQLLEDNAVPYDIVGVHWYQDMGEITCPGQPYPCPARPQHFNVIARVEKITHSKPMWVTETNYSPLPNASPEMNVSRKENYLVPTLQRYLSSSVYPFEAVFIYELLDEPDVGGGAKETQMGFFSVKRRSDGGYSVAGPKPTYKAVQRLYQQ